MDSHLARINDKCVGFVQLSFSLNREYLAQELLNPQLCWLEKQIVKFLKPLMIIQKIIAT